jgi:NAD(P)H-hydrate epimerase
VGSPEGRVLINPSGNPGLAQGGSGDVLAGFLAGWLAQPTLERIPERTIRYAVWDHGAAADRLEEKSGPWTPDDLISQLGLPLRSHPPDPLNPK